MRRRCSWQRSRCWRRRRRARSCAWDTCACATSRRVVGLTYDPDPKPSDPIQLTEDNYPGRHPPPRARRLDDAAERRRTRGSTSAVGASTTRRLAYGIADAVNAPPALWAGPRRNLPPRLQPPERPPHREPSAEMQRIRKLTEKRRSTRETLTARPETRETFVTRSPYASVRRHLAWFDTEQAARSTQVKKC